MGLYFRSLLSSSSGNCLLLWSETTAILIDCGVRSQRECTRLLAEDVAPVGKLAAVVVSHAHSDHICRPALRVLDREGVPVWCHEETAPQIHGKHVDPKDRPPALRLFEERPFEVGDLLVEPFRLAHAPGFATFGFAVHHRCAGTKRKAVFCTDFYSDRDMPARLADADFIFIEANHDLQLLRLFPNYASRFHFSNPKTGRLLSQAIRQSDIRPRTVMLGHLSKQRNTEALAAETIAAAFEADGQPMSFDLEVAPRYLPSKAIQIA